MGNDSSKATGTDFERNQGSREADNAASIGTTTSQIAAKEDMPPV